MHSSETLNKWKEHNKLYNETHKQIQELPPYNKPEVKHDADTYEAKSKLYMYEKNVVNVDPKNENVQDVIIENEPEGNVNIDDKNEAFDGSTNYALIELNYALIESWLTSTVCLPQYYQAFIINGYDTLDRIYQIESKEELIKIGITLKGHQTQLIAFIHKGRKGDSIDNNDDKDSRYGGVEYMDESSATPESFKDVLDYTLIQSWLSSTVNLPQYYEEFITNGYETLEQIYQIESKEELIKIGITLKGHQTGLMAYICRGRDDMQMFKQEIIENVDKKHIYPTPLAGDTDHGLDMSGSLYPTPVSSNPMYPTPVHPKPMYPTPTATDQVE